VRAGGGRGRPERAGAFSILEILIAISLMALLAGLVIPISIGAIARASALEAQPRLEAAVAQARLEAARLSAPVRLAAAAGGAAVRIEALEITRGDTDAGVTPLPGGAAGDLLGPGLFQEAPGAAGGPAAGEWVLLDEILLPQGIVLERRAEEAEGSGAGALSVFTMSSAPGEESAVDGEASDAKPWVFATALPDGRLEAGREVVVRAAARGDSGEARWSVQFAAWTGGVTLTPVRPDQEEEGFAEEDALPPPPPAGDSREGGAARDAAMGGAR
jgi:hypothetical protein